MLKRFRHLGLYCFHGNLLFVGYLLVFQILMTAQDKNLPAFFRKFVHGILDFLLQLRFYQRIVFDFIHIVDQTFNRKDLPVEFTVVTQVIQRFIFDSGGQIGSNRFGKINGGTFFPKRNEDLLCELLCNFCIFGILNGKPDQPPEFTPEERFESSGIQAVAFYGMIVFQVIKKLVQRCKGTFLFLMV